MKDCGLLVDQLLKAKKEFKNLKKQDSGRRAASDKILRDKTFNIAKNPRYDGYERGLLQWFINVLVKSLLHLQTNLLRIEVLLR